MSEDNKSEQSTGDKIATYIFRVIIGLLGVGLLVIFFVFEGWKKAGLKGLFAFSSITGLFIGYAVGGDIWGARIFGSFTSEQVKKKINAPQKVSGLKGALILSIILIGFLGMLLLGFFILALSSPHP